MNIKDILSKVQKGEELSDEERQYLASYDPDKALNDAAAAARRKAEEKAAKLEEERSSLQERIASLETKLSESADADKGDLEKAQNQIRELSKQMAALQEKVTTTEGEKAALQRSQRLSDIRREAGIQFVDGMDHTMLSKSFEAAFDGVEDLQDETLVKTKVNTWRSLNKAAVADTSGGGSGSQPHVGGTPSQATPVTMDGDSLVDAALHGDVDEAEKAIAQAEKADAAGVLTLN